MPNQVNQVWPNLSTQGAVWGVTAQGLPALGANGTLTLTTGDGYYWPSLSNLGGTLPTGTCVYVQVDSANANTTYGAVLEDHEASGGTYDNISGLQLVGPAPLNFAPTAPSRAAPSNLLAPRQ